MSRTSTPTQLQPPQPPQPPSSSSSTSPTQQDDDRKLAFQTLTTPRDRADALKLVVDSVAQQRQVASRDVVFNPICVSALVAALAVAHGAMRAMGHDFSAMLITYSGIVLIYLSTIRYAASTYIRIAEETDWHAWLENEDGGEAVVLGARYGTELIAAVVLDIPKQRNARAKAQPKATIRAWTTKIRYRRRGLGGDMLREAVKAAKQARGPNCAVEFAADHVHSSVALYDLFNGPFVSRQAQAVRALATAVKEVEAEDSSQR